MTCSLVNLLIFFHMQFIVTLVGEFSKNNALFSFQLDNCFSDFVKGESIQIFQSNQNLIKDQAVVI